MKSKIEKGIFIMDFNNKKAAFKIGTTVFKRFATKIIGLSLVLMFLFSIANATEVHANTGFVENSFSHGSPYGFIWTNTNFAPVDATNSTHGMFSFNYKFISGSDWRVDLGRPTTFNGTVDINIFNANVRSDKNVALFPPAYGIFSGEFMTDPTNPWFTQPVNPRFWYVNMPESPDGLRPFDTLQQGINSPNTAMGEQSQVSINPLGTGGFLPSTSINE